MKKKWRGSFFLPKKALTKTLRVMKLTFFFSFMLNFNLFASDVFIREDGRLNVNLENVTLKEALKRIEEASGYEFFYHVDRLDLSCKIDFSGKGMTLNEVLNHVLSSSGAGYKIVDKHILITAADEKKDEIVQQKNESVRGRVVGSNGEPIPGISIVVDGTTMGTITDVDGGYILYDVPENAVLVFSFIGMETKKIPIDGKRIIDVVMKEESLGLDEVVVIGYGTQKKEDLSSSIAILAPKELQKVPGGFQAGLQSSVPGIQITGDKIRIRGVGSINNTDPLYVIDGMIGGATPDESNIASIQILKDAASCAIYGARGANGVILITTKRGEPGQTKIEYDAYWGFKDLTNDISLLNGQQLAELINEEMYNADPSRTDYLPALSDPAAIGKGYNMMDELLRTGSYQKHNLSISGGSENANFRINSTYGTDKPVTIKEKTEDYAVQFISDFTKGKLKIGETVHASLHKRDWSDYNIIDAQRWSSTLPVYDFSEETGFGGAGNGTDGANPLAAANLNWNDTESLAVNGNVWAILEIIPGLEYKFNFGADLNRSRTQNYESAYIVGNYQSNTSDDLSISSSQTNRFLYENTLSYKKDFGKHNVSALVGVTSEESKYKYLSSAASSFPSQDVLILSATQDASTKEVGSDINKSAMFSLLGRVNYSYASKYMLTANFRRDGSSNFGESNRYGNFPSFSAAWRISQENFMKNVSFLTDLKLRGSYGVIGNSNIDPYQYQTTVSFTNIWYYLNDTKVTGALPVSPSNPDVKWESQYSTDLGFDMSLFNNQVSITFDYYNKKTEDMLVNVPISYAAGYLDNAPTLNAGSIRNKGIEISASFRQSKGKFNYSISGNLSTVNNEVLSLGSNNEIFSGSISPVGEYVTRTAVGHSIGQFWGYVTNDLYTTQEQLDEDKKFAPNAELGDVRFVDLDGDDAITADKDKTFIGNPIPDFSYGLSADASYDTGKGIVDFAMVWQGCYGNDIYSNMRYWGEGMYHYYNNFASTLDRYRAEDLDFTNPVSGVTTVYPKNTDTDIPRAVLGDPNKNLRVSDRFIENGSYLRLKTLTIGYSLPVSLLSKYKIERLRFYVGGKNLITLTDYDGFDPEVPSDNDADNGRYNLNRGIDALAPWGLTFPNTKEIFFGVQCTF
jgi:TonB-linked SusC/RagA family outer membrane protein